MSPHVERVERAALLPAAWDALAENLFQRRAFLAHTERENPCAQRYYLLREGSRLLAGAVVYTIRLDLLTYSGLRSPLPMQVVGLPCSVAWPGLLGGAEALVERLARYERGLVVALNTTGTEPPPGAAAGRTLPTLVIPGPFASWGDYRSRLRSSYRRRLDRLTAPWAEVEERALPCSAMTRDAWSLYLEAFQRSDAKLERLSWSFFRSLPPDFVLTTCHHPSSRRPHHLVGWHVSAVEPGRVTFFMGGTDQEANPRLNVYFNLLASVLRLGIDREARHIDLGQTAEVPKSRLGGQPEERGLFAWHRCRVARSLLRRAAPLLEYRRDLPEHHVFKQAR